MSRSFYPLLKENDVPGLRKGGFVGQKGPLDAIIAVKGGFPSNCYP